jgi:DNA gyrase subunit A
MRDESNRKGLRLVIELKQGAIPEVVLNNLYKFSALQSSFGIIDLALVDGVPRTLSLREMLQHYIDHQVDVVTRRTRFDLAKAQARAHILEGLLIALDNIDEVIHIIRSSRTDAEASERLIGRFGFTKEQTNAILEMRLRRLTGLERDKIQEELEGLVAPSPTTRTCSADQRQDPRGHQAPRCSRSRSATPTSAAPPSPTPRWSSTSRTSSPRRTWSSPCTHAGYIKRLPVATYRSQKRGGKGVQGLSLKDNDFVEDLFVASTHDYVLFFTNKGKVYRAQGP